MVADLICPDCRKLFNTKRDRTGKTVTSKYTLYVYVCPHCKHTLRHTLYNKPAVIDKE